MNWFNKVQVRFQALFQKRKLDTDMDEEMRAHIEMRTQENVDAGMSPEEARYAALRQFGWVESIKETCRDARGVTWLEDLAQDVRYGARMLRKNPGFMTVAVLTLALGIGANTAIFSVVDGVLLKPLAYPESVRLVWLSERGLDWSGEALSYPNFIDWKTQQTVFEHFGVYAWNNVTLTGNGEPIQLRGALMSADTFAALRVQPLLGRTFAPDDDKPGAAPVVVLSHALWQNRFGADPAVISRTLTLDGHSCTVVGVMPAGFAFPSQVEVWAPVGPLSADANWQDRNNHPGLWGLARLKPGTSLGEARAQLDTIAMRLEQQYPSSNKNRRVQVDKLLNHEVGGVGRALWTLLAATGLVLLIACANIANLLLARAAARQKEFAVRAALGAGRGRLIRQLLVESVLLALFGAAAGLLLAHWGLHSIVSMSQGRVPRVEQIGLDLSVLSFSAALAIATGILFGLAPACHASRPNLHDTLKDTAPSVTGGRARFRHSLVVVEVALTLLLLIGAGLFLRSFQRLVQVNPGFGYKRVLTLQINLPERKYANVDQPIRFYTELLERVRAIPGVQVASIASRIPLDESGWGSGFVIEGRPEPPPYDEPSMAVHLVAPDYFRTMGIPMLKGRDFTAQDNRAHLRGTNRESDWGAGLNAVIIDEEFAKKYWPNQDAVGQQIRVASWAAERDRQPVLTVVGVVGRVKEDRLSGQGGMVQAYLPFLQRPSRGMAVVIKTTHEPESSVSAVRRQVLAIDPDQPIFEIHTMREMRTRNMAPERLNFALLGVFAAVALMLAVVGLYGVLAYAVSQRQREIGVRIALGAQRRDVLALVVGHGTRLAGLGMIIGLIGAVALTRSLQTLLFEIRPLDLATFVCVPAILSVIVLLACWFPARCAAKVDPMVALRHE